MKNFGSNDVLTKPCLIANLCNVSQLSSEKSCCSSMSSVDILPTSPLGRAIRYTLTRWQGLLRYAEAGSGEVEIDNNPVENAIRPTAIGKKNWLFIGHPKAGQTSAIIYTMVENCRMWDIDPMEYLNDVLPRIMDHPKSRIAELLPRQWKQAREAEAAEAAAA